MSDVRAALLDFLHNTDDEARRGRLGETLGDVELPAARSASAEDPASADAAARVLGKMLHDGASDADVVDAAKALAQRAPRDEKGVDVTTLAGVTVWRVGGQPQLAEPYFRRVRRADAAHAEVLAFYRELFSSKADARQLMQVLGQARRASKDTEQRLELAGEMANLAMERLESPDRAIEVWRSVVREDGADTRAVQALETLYREQNKWTALVELLKERVDRIPDDEGHKQERIDGLLEVANLYREQLKLDTMALATLQRILEIDPAHEESLQAIASTYAGANRYNDLLGVYEKLIDRAAAAEDTERQADLLLKVAEIWLEKLANPQRALEPLARLTKIRPEDPQARTLLASIHEKRRDWRALIALRREEVVGKSDDEALEKRVALAKMAEERLGDRREAIADWNAVLENHGDVDVALVALGRLYERESRWAEAAEILHRRVKATTETEPVHELLVQLGNIYSDRLRSRADAVRVWAEVLRLFPGHDKATRMLRDAYVAEHDWDALTELYAGQDRLAAVVDVLQSAADRVQEIPARVELYRRVAGLCRDRLKEPERALKALERTLAIQPDNLEVARELLPIYREQRDFARLLRTYEVLLAAAQEEDEQLTLLGEMRSVAASDLGSAALALRLARRAYELRPQDDELRDQLELAAENADGWDDLCSVFEARLKAEGIERDESLLLLDKLATIARDRLLKPDDAQRYFRQIVELDPSNESAMGALQDIYSGTRRWDDLADVYRRRLEVASEPEERLSTLKGLAKLQEESLQDLEAASKTFGSILEIAETDVAALEGLARIHRTQGNWAELAGILERQLQADGLSPAQTITLRFELSQVRATRLREYTPAIDGFLAVLELEPNHASSVSALEAIREADPATSVRIVGALLPYYRRVEDRTKEAEALEVLIGATEDPAERDELLEKLAGTYEKLGGDRLGGALDTRLRLVRSRPESWDNRQAVLALARSLGRVGDASGAHRDVLDTIAAESREAADQGHTLPRERAALRRDLLLERAIMLRDDLGQTGDAEQAYREVLDQDETHQAAYESLESLLSARGAHAELAQLYRRRVDVVFNPREQQELLSRIIRIAREVLGDRDTAVQTAEELLDLVPDDLPTIKLLADLYGEGDQPSDHENLEALLGRWIELMEPGPKQAGLTCRRAQLRMEFLGDAFGAVDLLGQLLAEHPDHRDARELLEQLLDVSEVQVEVCALLEPLYVRVGDHNGRVRILRVRRARAEAQGSGEEAANRLVELAQIQETDLRDPLSAFESVREAYLLDPRRVDIQGEVSRLGLGLGHHGDLITVWRAALADERVADPSLRIDLTHRIARLADERLGDREQARDAYGQLLAMDPPDLDLVRHAVGALCRLHLEAGDGVALVDAKRAYLRFAESSAEQAQVRLEIAEIQEQHLGDRVGAAMTYSEVVDMEADNGQALEALERLFLEEEEWALLTEVLTHRVTVTADPRTRSSLWHQVGTLRRDRLEDVEGAIAAFQSILDLKVGRDDTVDALQALLVLHEKLEHWPDVEEVLKRLTKLAAGDAQRGELMRRTAEVTGRKLGRGQDALELLKRILDRTPRDEAARDMVRSYLNADETRDKAIGMLLPLFEAERNWAALLELEELQARHQPSGRRRLQALMQVAHTSEERLQDSARAFSVLCGAMTEAADQPELSAILEKVERLGTDPSRAEALLKAYAETVDHILDSDLQLRVRKNMGLVSLERTNDVAAARGAFEKALEIAPGDVSVLDALERIYATQADAQALTDLLLRRAERSDDEATRDGYLVRAAELQRVQLELPEDAIRTYERLSENALNNPEVQDALEPLLEQTGRHQDLATHLNRKVARLRGKELVDAHLRLGRLHGEHLGDVESGIRHFATALRLDPDHAVGTSDLERYLDDASMRLRVAEMLEPVFAAVQDWPRLAQMQEIRLAECNDPDERVGILLRIARIEEEQLEDLERAYATYARVFEHAPTNAEVRDHLSRLAGILGRVDGYANLLTTYLEGPGEGDGSDEALEVLKEAANLWANALREPSRAIPLLVRLRDAKPDDASVFAALEAALIGSSSWQELVEAYWRECDASMDEERQVELLQRLANAATEWLEAPGEAIRAYQRVLEIRPDHDAARVRLERLLDKEGRSEDLLDVLRDRHERTTDPQQRGNVAVRIAELQAGALANLDDSIGTLEALLEEAPGHPEGVSLLEAIARESADHRDRIVPLLRPVYEQLVDIPRLIELDDWQLATADDPTRRHELFLEIATLHQKGSGSAPAAFDVLARALGEPGPEDSLARLDDAITRIADVMGDPDRYAQALVRAADAESLVDDIERRLELLGRAATVRIQQGSAEPAAEVLRKALALAPDHEQSLSRLDDCLVHLGERAELEEVLRRRIDVATADDERVDMLRRLGRLLEEGADDRDKAKAPWRDLLDLSPDDREALEALTRLGEQTESGTELAEILQRRVDVAGDPTERRDLRLRLAGIQRAQGDRSGEVDVLQACLEENNGDHEVMGLLVDALLAEERHAEAADILDERSNLAEVPEDAAGHGLQAARLYRDALGDAVGALERYERVLERLPAHSETVNDLIGLARDPDHSERATSLVVPQLERSGQFDRLAEVLANRAELVEDPQERAEALRALVALRSDTLDDAGGALEAQMAVLDQLETPEVRAGIELAGSLAGRANKIPEFVDGLAERAADLDREPETRVLLASAASMLCEDVLADRGRALDLLRPLVEMEVDAELGERMERLGRSVEDMAFVAEVLRARSNRADDDGQRAELLVRLGDVSRTLGEQPAAVDAYRDALDLRGDDAGALEGLSTLVQGAEPLPEALDVLEGAYQNLGHQAGLASVAQRRLDLSGGTPDLGLLQGLATLQEEGGGTPTDALETWGRLLAADPENDQARGRVLGIAREHGLLPRAADLLGTALASATEQGMTPVPLALETAQLLLVDLGSADTAMQVLGPVLEDQPDMPEALELLVAAARARGVPADLHDALGRRAGAVDDAAAIECLVEAAQIAGTQLEDLEKAANDLERVIALDEHHDAAWSGLLQALRILEQWPRTVEALSRRIVLAEADERRALRHEQVDILVDRLEKVEDAVAVLEDAVADDPEDQGSLVRLEELLRKLERWDDVRETLERRVSTSADDGRILLLEQLAKLAETELEDPSDAIERYRAILMELPAHAVADASLERLLRAESRTDDLAELLEQRMAHRREIGDTEGFRSTASTLAELLAGELDQAERAQDILNELLEVDPGYVPAILALAEVYKARGDEGAMRLTLQRAADENPPGPVGAEVAMRLAELDADDDDLRQGHLRRALELDPTHEGAANELLSAFRKAKEWNTVAELLGHIAGHVTDPERKRALQIEQVDLLTNELDRSDSALEILHGIYQEVQDDVDINRRIADTLFAADLLEDAEGMYGWLIETGREQRRSKSLAHDLTRLGRILLHKGEVDGARERLTEAYRIDTTNPETMLSLGDVHEKTDDWPQALKVYRSMLLQNAEQSGLVRRGDLYVRLARAHIALDEEGKAKAMARRGWEEDRGHEELAQILDQLGASVGP